MANTGCNDLGKFTNVRFWTIEAAKCYLRGCVCKGCPHEEGFPVSTDTDALKRPCQMKATVLELVRRWGSPTASRQVCIRKIK